MNTVYRSGVDSYKMDTKYTRTKCSKMASLFKQALHAVWNYIFQRELRTIMCCIYCFTVLLLINTHTNLAKRYDINGESIKHMSRSLRAISGMEPPVLGYKPEGTNLQLPNNSNVETNIRENESAIQDNTGNIPEKNKVQIKQNPVNNGIVGEDGGLLVNVNNDKAPELNKDKGKHAAVNAVEVIQDKPKDIVVPIEKIKPAHRYKRVEPREGVWQNVTADGTLLLFSAGVFQTADGRRFVRGLAINGNNFFPKVLCVLIYDTSSNVTVRGKVWMLPDHHEKDYKTVYVLCPLPDDRTPGTLSVVEQTDTVLRNAVPVIHHERETRLFTVCLSPLFFNRSIEYELVQWIELNRLMGADMFHVYNYSTVGRTDEILNHYVKEGIVQVIQWRIPSYTDIHYYGQIAMMNDCLFRNVRISRYMVNIDMDEFIVPRKGVTKWADLMPTLPSEFCEYSFRSSFLVTESKDVFPGKQMARELHITALLRITRREYIFDKNVRTKYIVNTTCMDTVGIHFCWRYTHGTEVTQRYHVPPRAALMFHYRNEAVTEKGKEIQEKGVYKYHEELIANVRNRWDKIDNEKKEKASV